MNIKKKIVTRTKTSDARREETQHKNRRRKKKNIPIARRDMTAAIISEKGN